jgi:hypothetical protein
VIPDSCLDRYIRKKRIQLKQSLIEGTNSTATSDGTNVGVEMIAEKRGLKLIESKVEIRLRSKRQQNESKDGPFLGRALRHPDTQEGPKVV